MKVKFTFNQKNQLTWLWPLNTPAFQHRLPQFGVKVVRQGWDYEFAESTEAKPTGPTVIFDRYDTSIVSRGTYHWHHNEHVVGFVIPVRHTNRLQALEYREWSDAECGPVSKPVEHLCTMLWHNLFMKPYHYQHPKKVYRCSFLGSLHYPRAKYPEPHRRKMVEAWARIPGHSLAGFVSHKSRPFTHEQSWESSMLAKSVVSPWGVVELCWRDYQAILGCAMTIKPRQRKIECYASPWVADNVVWCEPDYSDLSEAVDKAEALWDRDYLENLRQSYLKIGRDLDKLAFEVAQTLKRFADVLP